jgi:hypothetical protein
VSIELKKYLFDQYGGFADRRVKDLSKDCPFKIDDQSDKDSPDRFCSVFVKVTGMDRFMLSLDNNAPVTPDIKDFVELHGGKIYCNGERKHIEIEISVEDVDFLKRLSYSIRALVTPGRYYEDRNWIWLCPRTADSLERFAQVLDEFQEHQKTINGLPLYEKKS